MCATPELPRKPTLTLPPEATPNLMVDLDVMPHKIHTKAADLLVIIDHGDMLIRLKMLPDRSAPTTFNAFYNRWIAMFDAPTYIIVNRSLSLSTEHMKTKIYEFELQHGHIPTEAPWGIGLNERSHRYIHKSITRLLLEKNCETELEHKELLAEEKTGWNYAQHTNKIRPLYHRFGIMPRIIGSLDEISRLTERVALVQLVRQEKDTPRARDFISRALDPNHRIIVPITTFGVSEKVWFHRHRFGWRQGFVASMELPTIMIKSDGRLYPTHETLVHRYFGQLSIPCALEDDHLTHKRPNPSNGRVPLSDILHPVFVTSHVLQTYSLSFEIPQKTY